MKIIEAMKQIKLNKEKINDLQSKVRANSAHLNIHKPEYTREQVSGWVQSCHDLAQENVRMLTAIARTNLATQVTIELGGKPVTKSITEWIWRRREYAALDQRTQASFTDGQLRGHEGKWATPEVEGEPPVKTEIVRYYDSTERDTRIEMYREEPTRIDAALEIVNATTDLQE